VSAGGLHAVLPLWLLGVVCRPPATRPQLSHRHSRWIATLQRAAQCLFAAGNRRQQGRVSRNNAYDRLVRRARLACVSRAFRRFCAQHSTTRLRQHTVVAVPLRGWEPYVRGVSRWLAWHARTLRTVHVDFEVRLSSLACCSLPMPHRIADHLFSDGKRRLYMVCSGLDAADMIICACQWTPSARPRT